MRIYVFIFFVFLFSCQPSENDKFFDYLEDYKATDIKDKNIVLVNLEGCIDCVNLQLRFIGDLAQDDLKNKLFIFTGKVLAEDHDDLLDGYNFDFFRDTENRIIQVLPNYTNGIIYNYKTDELNYISDEKDFINYITNL
ncbi:MAG: hypothetical protein DSY77_17425 [Bacteroidetes bacterium]|jgi:hypothetical protein|nr:MAG: hypothetical protein DSY77_17425 [Bacteroidota bacterium]